MVKLFISLLVVIVATNVTIAHCKHKNREIFHPSPNNEGVVDEIPSHTDKHSRRRGHKKHKENTNDDILEIVPDIHLKKNHQRDGDEDNHNIHISIEFDDKDEVNLEGNGKTSSTHKITKKDLPDWSEDKHDLNWNTKDNNKWDNIDYTSKNWNHNDGWNNDPSDYNKWNHGNHEIDTIYKDEDALKIFVPEIGWNRNGKKNKLVQLNDIVLDFISNASKSSLDHLHDIETDLLNVNLDFKPVLSVKTESTLDSDYNDPGSVKWNNDKWNNEKRKSFWDQSREYQKWLEKHLRNKLDQENRNSHRGVNKGRDVVKVQEEELESDWSNEKNDHKRWNIEIEVPQRNDGKKKLKRRNHRNWKFSDDDDVNADVTADATADASADGNGNSGDGINPVA